MQRFVYCRRCDKRTAHTEDRSWSARWQCTACNLRSFDDELEVAHGLYLLCERKDGGVR